MGPLVDKVGRAHNSLCAPHSALGQLPGSLAAVEQARKRCASGHCPHIDAQYAAIECTLCTLFIAQKWARSQRRDRTTSKYH